MQLLNPCAPKTRLTLAVEFIEEKGAKAKATKGPYAYTPYGKDCLDGRLIEEATEEDAMAILGGVINL